MCGRFNLTATPESIIGHFRLLGLPDYQPSFNIPPAQAILNIVELEDRSRKAVNLFWGLVPSWAKDTKNSQRLINARAETVLEKPSFRVAFRKRRCLIPATGFYEWQTRDFKKQAFHIHRPDLGLFAFAGVWEHWQHELETLYSCCIITTAATKIMRPIHERMPVILPETHYQKWLDRSTDVSAAFHLLDNQAYSAMTASAISDWVNNPRHDDDRCLR